VKILRSHRGEEFVEGGIFHRRFDREDPGRDAQFDRIPFPHVDLARHDQGDAQGETVAPFLNARLPVSSMRPQGSGVRDRGGIGEEGDDSTVAGIQDSGTATLPAHTCERRPPLP